MRNRDSPKIVIVGVLLCLYGAWAKAAELPRWVPEDYRQYFVRFVDDRPAWERALNHLDVDVGDTGRSFALIVGVSQYPNITGPEANLRPANVDVQKLTAYLTAEPESFNEVVVLTEADVTVTNLRYFLTNYFPRRLAAAPRSRFLFAYSGHGTTTESGDGFLLGHTARSLQDYFDAGISLNEVRVWLQPVVREGHQVLALINACYGAAFHRLSMSFGPTNPVIPRREGAHAITAGGSGELTWHDPAFGEGSIFFEALLAAVDGRADRMVADGVVTIDELQTYLRATISRFTDERQNPIAGDLRPKGSPGGFFFLDRRRLEEEKTVSPLKDDWWQAFGESVDVFEGEETIAQPTPAMPLGNENVELSQIERMRIQSALNELGHAAGFEDGVIGPATRDAVKRYQHALNKPATGNLTNEQIDALLEKAREARLVAVIKRGKMNYPVYTVPHGYSSPNAIRAICKAIGRSDCAPHSFALNGASGSGCVSSLAGPHVCIAEDIPEDPKQWPGELDRVLLPKQ